MTICEILCSSLFDLMHRISASGVDTSCGGHWPAN